MANVPDFGHDLALRQPAIRAPTDHPQVAGGPRPLGIGAVQADESAPTVYEFAQPRLRLMVQIRLRGVRHHHVEAAETGEDPGVGDQLGGHRPGAAEVIQPRFQNLHLARASQDQSADQGHSSSQASLSKKVIAKGGFTLTYGLGDLAGSQFAQTSPAPPADRLRGRGGRDWAKPTQRRGLTAMWIATMPNAMRW